MNKVYNETIIPSSKNNFMTMERSNIFINLKITYA